MCSLPRGDLLGGSGRWAFSWRELAQELFGKPAMRGVLRGRKQPSTVGAHRDGGICPGIAPTPSPSPFTTAPFAWTSATSDVRNLNRVISNCKRDPLRNFLNSGCIRCCDRPAALVGRPAFDRVLKAGLEDRLLTGGKLSWRAWPSNPPCLPSAPPRRPSPCPRRPPAPPSAWMS